MKKVLITTCITLLSIICFTFIFVVYIYTYGTNFEKNISMSVDITHNELKTIKAVGKRLYESNGNYI